MGRCQLTYNAIWNMVSHAAEWPEKLSIFCSFNPWKIA